MIITYFRSSSYNGWAICPQQYFLTYVLGQQAPSGKRAEMGTVFHKVMEALANGKKCVQDGVSTFEDDALGTLHGIDEALLFDMKYVEHLFEQSFHFYTNPNKSVHKYAPRDKKEIWEWLVNILESQEDNFDPRLRDIVAAEPHFDITIDEPWAEYEYTLPDGKVISGNLAIKGTIDLVTCIGPSHYETVDWKTGQCKNWGTGKEKFYEDFKVDPQLRMYHYALSKMFPKVESIAMTMHWIRTKGPYTVAYDSTDMEATLKMLRKRFETIKHTVRPRLKSPTGAHWFCKRVCWFGKNQHPKDPTRTYCKYIADETRKNGINSVMSNETAPGFDIGYYHDPGS